MLGLDVSGTLIKDSCLVIKLGNASDELVGVAKTFIARMAKLLMPQQLFCPCLDGMHWDGFVDEQLETTKVHSFELVWGIVQRLIELAMLSCFDVCDLSIESMFTNVNEQGVFSLCEAE